MQCFFCNEKVLVNGPGHPKQDDTDYIQCLVCGDYIVPGITAADLPSAFDNPNRRLPRKHVVAAQVKRFNEDFGEAPIVISEHDDIVVRKRHRIVLP